MARSDHLLYERSPPARVIFAGMEGYTPTMEANGWEFYLETSQDSEFMRGRFQMTMRHQQTGCVLMAQGLSDEFREAAFNLRRNAEPVFRVSRMSQERHTEISFIGSVMPTYERVSMIPTDSMQTRRMRLVDLFTQWAPEAQEIIVEPKTVAALMAEIVSLQQPELAEIRRRAYVRDRGRPEHDQMVAQIIAFAA